MGRRTISLVFGALSLLAAVASASCKPKTDDGVVGAYLSLSGADSTFGTDTRDGIDLALTKRSSDDAAGDALAVTHDQIGNARCELENGGQAAQDFVERIKLLIDKILQGSGVGRVLDQSASRISMAAAQARTDSECAGAVPGRGGCGGAQQLIGNLGHGADHNHRLLALGNAAGDDCSGAVDGGRVFDRRAAKLHDNQAHLNLSKISKRARQLQRPAPIFLNLRAVQR